MSNLKKMMKKKHFIIMTIVIFAFSAIDLQAQDSPNGGTIPGGGNTVLDPLPWRDECHPFGKGGGIDSLCH
jgi:hypothetical protein